MPSDRSGFAELPHSQRAPRPTTCTIPRLASPMTTTGALLAGLGAGYAVAIPVGAVAVLIVETGTRRGFRIAASAGLGAATADLVYAALAVLLGSAVAAVLAPWATPVRWVSVLVLALIGARLLASAASVDPGPAAGASEGRGPLATYGGFVGITLLNPTTVAYFAALVLGLPSLGGAAQRLAFVVAAFVASASWQLLLAAVGSLLHRHASERLRRATTALGGLLILAIAGTIARGLLAS